MGTRCSFNISARPASYSERKQAHPANPPQRHASSGEFSAEQQVNHERWVGN